MRRNGRPLVLVSTLPPDQVNLRPGEPITMACPVCGRWRRVKRHMLWPHRAFDGRTRCPGSGQRIQIDLAPGEWLVRLRAVSRAARRTTSLQRATERAFRQTRARQHPGAGAT